MGGYGIEALSLNCGTTLYILSGISNQSDRKLRTDFKERIPRRLSFVICQQLPPTSVFHSRAAADAPGKWSWQDLSEGQMPVLPAASLSVLAPDRDHHQAPKNNNRRSKTLRRAVPPVVRAFDASLVSPDKSTKPVHGPVADRRSFIGTAFIYGVARALLLPVLAIASLRAGFHKYGAGLVDVVPTQRVPANLIHGQQSRP